MRAQKCVLICNYEEYTNGSLQGIHLVDSVNLNNLVDVGHYYAYGGNTIAGKPTGVSAFGLEVYRVAGSYVAQCLTDSGGDNRMFLRIYDTHTWSEWTEFVKKGDLNAYYKYEGAFTGDLNNANIKPGFYAINEQNSVENGPPGISYCVFWQIGIFSTQLIIDAASIYQRHFTGNPGRWGNWSKHTGTTT